MPAQKPRTSVLTSLAAFVIIVGGMKIAALLLVPLCSRFASRS